MVEGYWWVLCKSRGVRVDDWVILGGGGSLVVVVVSWVFGGFVVM